MPDAQVRLELLGAPRVLRAGEPRRLPIRKTLALLAVLAVDGRCTRARLATLLWDGLDDDAARRNLRRELHRLRESGLGDLVDGTDPLALAPHVTSDVAAFSAALAGGDAGAALPPSATLLEGFDLADAPAFEDWLSQSRERLAAAWREATAREARRLETGGDLKGALQLQERLLAHDPLQEAHTVDLMRLLALQGERGAALERYEQLRRTLEHELGLEPLPATVALAERLRAAEQLAPWVARSSAAGLARFEAPVVGREAELQRIGARRTVATLLVGEPGVGKSRLAQAAGEGRTPAITVQGSALSRGAPLQVVAEALRDALRTPEARARLALLPAATRRELARLLPQEAQAEVAAEAPSPAVRARFFAAVADTLQAFAGHGVLRVEDLHWVDDATVELLEAFVQRLGRERAQGAETPLVVVTARSHELASHAAAREALRRLERGGLVDRLDVAPLPAAATLALVRALSGSAGGERFAQRLQRATDGNPYFLLETLRFLFDTGELAIDARGVWTTRYDDATADYAELPVPPSVEQAVVERVERLGAAAQRLLEAAALADDPFTLDDVQGATALSDWEAVDGLERAAQAALLAPVAAAPAAAWRFAHELARQAIEHHLGRERRRLIHRRLAATLEAQRGRPDRIAHHLQRAGDDAAALPWWTAAAQAAERVFAWREALAFHAQALAAEADPARRVAIHRARQALLRPLFDTAGLLAEADALAALAPQLPAERLDLEAQGWRIRAHNLAERFAPALEAAAALPADRSALPPALRHDLALAVAQTRHGAGDLAGAAAELDAELTFATALTPAQRLELHLQRGSLGMSRSLLAQAEQDAEAALALARQLQQVDPQVHAANQLGYVRHVKGDTAGALQVLAEAQAAAERAGLVGAQRSLLTNLVKLHVVLGDADAARARLQQSIALFADVDDAATWARLRSREVEVELLAGDLGAALRAARTAVALLEGIGSAAGTFWPWYQLALLLWQCGDAEAAVGVYRDLPQSPAWSALAQPAVDFFGVVLQLPAAPAAVAAALETLPPGGDHAHHDARDHAFWRAMALHGAGRAREAQAIAATLEAPPFTLHPAAVLALRLAVARAAGADATELATTARAALAGAPPLEALELAAALGDDVSARVERLTATLDGEPALQARLRARFQPCRPRG